MIKVKRTIRVYIPDNDRILIKQDTSETITGGGIIIPDTAKEKPQIGVIVARGPDADPKWEIGKKVMYGKYAGTEIDFNFKTFVVLRENDLSGEILEFEDQDPDDWDLDTMRPKKKVQEFDTKGRAKKIKK